MTTYEQLRKIIIASNPSLLKLSFGCEIQEKRIDTFKPRVWKYITKQRSNNYMTMIEDDGEIDGEYFKDDEIKFYKIIGHPITFRHVMIAMNEKEMLMSRLTSVASNGGFYDKGKLKARWNFQKNTLAEQSEETQNWLLEVLK